MRPNVSIRLSQCMIVKNEEKNIERALSWGKEIMWEQVVVDTGSTDRTVELAEKLGARVFRFTWIDDFAAAKNYAIGQAGGDWIAFLDADEYMMPEDVRKMPDILEELERRKLDGLSTGWQQLDDRGQIFSSGTQVRFFKNSQDIRYRRRIHEQLESRAGRPLRLGDGAEELSIFHTGYQGENLRGKIKSGRNRTLILKELESNPHDFEMMGYMGDECLDSGEKDAAEEWYGRAIEHMPEQIDGSDQRSAVTFTRMLILLTEKEPVSLELVENIYGQGTEKLPWEADLDYVMGHFYAVQGQMKEAVVYLENALHKLNLYKCNNKALLLAANLPEAYELLTGCCCESGDLEKGITYGVAYLKYNKYGMGVLERILKVLLAEEGDGIYEAVLNFLSQLYDWMVLKDKLFLLKAVQRSGCNGFASYIIGRIFSAEERQALKL